MFLKHHLHQTLNTNKLNEMRLKTKRFNIHYSQSVYEDVLLTPAYIPQGEKVLNQKKIEQSGRKLKVDNQGRKSLKA